MYVFWFGKILMLAQCCLSSWEGLDDWGLPCSGEAKCRACTQYKCTVFCRCETALRGCQARQLGLGEYFFWLRPLLTQFDVIVFIFLLAIDGGGISCSPSKFAISFLMGEYLCYVGGVKLETRASSVVDKLSAWTAMESVSESPWCKFIPKPVIEFAGVLRWAGMLPLIESCWPSQLFLSFVSCGEKSFCWSSFFRYLSILWHANWGGVDVFYGWWNRAVSKVGGSARE